MVALSLLFSSTNECLLVNICAVHHQVQFPKVAVIEPPGKRVQDTSDHTSLTIIFVTQLLASMQEGVNQLSLALSTAHLLHVILFLPKACHCLQEPPALSEWSQCPRR